MELGGGSGERDLVGTPRPDGDEEDIFFFAAQVIELAEDDGCHLFRNLGCTDGCNGEHRVVEQGHAAVLATAGVPNDAGEAEGLRGVSEPVEPEASPYPLPGLTYDEFEHRVAFALGPDLDDANLKVG